MRYVLALIVPILSLLLLCVTLGAWHWALVGIWWVLLSGLGVAVGYHRIFSHTNVLLLTSWLQTLLLVLGTMAGQGSSVTWRSVHQGYHHKYTDTPQDLHTPNAGNGFWYAFALWYADIDPHSISHRSAIPLLSKKNSMAWLHKLLHVHYFKSFYGLGVVVSAVVGYLLGFGFIESVGSWIIAVGLSLLQDNSVNAIAHIPIRTWPRWLRGWFVYRTYTGTNEESVNLPYMSLVGWGQFLHNNHHALPTTFSFATPGSYEIDPCVLFYPLIKAGTHTHDSRKPKPTNP